MLKPLVSVWVLYAGAGCIESKVCTEIGCVNQASITLQRPDWMTEPLAVDLEVDGREIACPAPTPRSAAGHACDDAHVRVEHRELRDCTETRTATAVSLTCVPNGRLVQVISITGTPQRVVATVLAGSSVVGQRIFELSYTSMRPNGDGCEPICRQGSETWVLP